MVRRRGRSEPGIACGIESIARSESIARVPGHLSHRHLRRRFCAPYTSTVRARQPGAAWPQPAIRKVKPSMIASNLRPSCRTATVAPMRSLGEPSTTGLGSGGNSGFHQRPHSGSQWPQRRRIDSRSLNAGVSIPDARCGGENRHADSSKVSTGQTISPEGRTKPMRRSRINASLTSSIGSTGAGAPAEQQQPASATTVQIL